jgi:hypothetical protein
LQTNLIGGEFPADKLSDFLKTAKLQENTFVMMANGSGLISTNCDILICLAALAS